MSEYFTENPLLAPESDITPIRIYFKADPDPEALAIGDIDDFEEIVEDRFGLSVGQTQWNEETVYSLDCSPEDLELVNALVEDMGFWKLLESEKTYTVSSKYGFRKQLSLP